MPNGSMRGASPSECNVQSPTGSQQAIAVAPKVDGSAYPSDLRHPMPRSFQEASLKPSGGYPGHARHSMPATRQDVCQSLTEGGGYMNQMQHPSPTSPTSYLGSPFAPSRSSGASAVDMPPPDRSNTQSLVR